jgi:hypothetical protein
VGFHRYRDVAMNSVVGAVASQPEDNRRHDQNCQNGRQYRRPKPMLDFGRRRRAPIRGFSSAGTHVDHGKWGFGRVRVRTGASLVLKAGGYQSGD